MGVLIRREDWPQRLAEVVYGAQRQPYVLGEWDCLRFCCVACEAMTGVDYWPRFAGYKTRRQAQVKIVQIAPTFGDAVTAVLGIDPVPVLMARRGDVVLYRDLLGEDHLGLCLGAKVAVLSPNGLLHLPLTEAGLRCAWRIG